MSDPKEHSMHDSIDDALSRAAAIAALGGVALVHVLQLPAAFAETLYLGLLFIGAVVMAVVLSVTLTLTSDERVWAAAAGLAALILLGYLVSRTSGLPAATDDVGEWEEPLGLVSMVVEGLLVCLGAGVLASRRAATPSWGRSPAWTRAGSHGAPSAS
jgi:hypothetical protein